MSKQDHWPSEIRLSQDKATLSVTFDDGRSFDLSAEYLRVLSPSAEVQGHSPDQRVTVAGKRDLTITNLEPIGNYAVRISFADGHNSGLYSWSYLYRLGDEREDLWTGYLSELAEKGLTRG